MEVLDEGDSRGFPVISLWRYLMKVIPETLRAYYIIFFCLYYININDSALFSTSDTFVFYF